MKTSCFVLFGLVAAVLAAATVVEKCAGAQAAARGVYGAAWFVVLWGVLALLAGLYIVRRRLFRRPAAFMLHAAFAVILAGAFVTWSFGRRGTLHLRTGESAAAYAADGGALLPLPFSVRLDAFRVEYYPGTRAPMDFVGSISVAASDAAIAGDVAMNRIMRFRGWRFYMSTYDADGGGATFAVSCDPWGIGVSYAGYALLLASMLALLVSRREGMRRVSAAGALRGTAVAAALLAAVAPARAAGPPPVLPRETADEMGALYVCYNDRICPLSTLARDFTVKLCGTCDYRGLTPEQVLSGWMFWYDEWKREPMIRIRSADVRRRMGLDGRCARLIDFYPVMKAGEERLPADVDEKFNVVSMVGTGAVLRIYPYCDPADGALRWASQVDALPEELPAEEWIFIRRSMNYVNELVARCDFVRAGDVFARMRTWQQQRAGEALPSALRFGAERIYARADRSSAAAAVLLVAGFVAFIVVCRAMALGRDVGRRAATVFAMSVAAALCYVTALLGLRWCVSGHPPMSNGYETMQLMAWCALALTLVVRRRFAAALPVGLLVAGAALAVAAMGGSNPQITPLVPVLASPLLSVHVMLVMISYSLLAFLMLNGIAGLWLARRRPAESARLRTAGLLMLYPALFSLAAGIFVGAVWANVSWGRYWGWDPKETWALITMMVYALPLHGESIAAFRRPAVFHGWCAAAFVSVAMTYFGVNFILGGMHGYAA
ncbi:MAG: cytochrome c biogenesis protein CcsA [Alistipes sp.]|nr:cytochrome c biogenesis protein CcsA [Alistipes sp.]